MIEGGSSGFSALLGGARYTDGGFDYLGGSGYYWSATESGSGSAWGYSFYRGSGELSRGSIGKSVGMSCRCAQDLTI